MKKRLFLFIVTFSLILSAQLQVFGAADEQLVNTLAQKTYYTKMIFNGSNSNWDCSYVVKAPVSESEQYCPKVKVILTPKFTWEAGVARKFKLHIHTTNGCIINEKALKNNESIVINANSPLPAATEKISVKVDWGFATKDVIELSNVVPENVISPRQAFESFIDAYYRAHQIYPTEKYTFDIEFYDKIYWLISFDDHDNIGGGGGAAINAFTGQVDGIKEEE